MLHVQPAQWTLLAALGAAAGIVLLLPWLVIVAGISVIGIPLAILMMALPFCFIIAAAATAGQGLLAQSIGPAAGAAVGAVAGLAALILPAHLVNTAFDRRVADYIGSDRDELTPAAAGAVIGLAVAQRGSVRRDVTMCDELCLRLLLAGTPRVLVADLGAEPAPNAQMPARGYRFVARTGCPVLRPQRNMGPWRFPEGHEAPNTATAQLALLHATGRCLIEEPATLADAQWVISHAILGEGHSARGYDAFSDRLQARRLLVHRREASGLAEAFRHTEASGYRFWPILVPSLVAGYGFEMHPGYLGDRVRFGEPVDPLAVITGRLGLRLSTVPAPDLAVPAGAPQPPLDPADVLGAALAGPGAFEPAITQLVESHIRRLADGRPLTPSDVPLLVRLIADPRFVPPYALRNIPKRALAARAMTPADFAPLARTALARIAATPPAANREAAFPRRDALQTLGAFLDGMPDATLAPHRTDLERIARTRDQRAFVPKLVSRLAQFGPPAIPVLREIISDTAAERREASRRRPFHDWHIAYNAAFMGLCRLGPAAGDELPGLIARLQSGELPLTGEVDSAVLGTLIRLGAAPQDLWPIYARQNPQRTEADFDRAIRNAPRNCGN